MVAVPNPLAVAVVALLGLPWLVFASVLEGLMLLFRALARLPGSSFGDIEDDPSSEET